MVGQIHSKLRGWRKSSHIAYYEILMRLDESKCEYQTMSLFDAVPEAVSQPAKLSGEAEIYFDGGCLGNPGQMVLS